MTFGVVIVAWNGEKHIEACLRSVLNQHEPPTHIVVIDNASGDQTLALVAQQESTAFARGITLTVIQESGNTGFTTGANTGMQRFVTDGGAVDAVVLLNQDAALDPGWSRAVADVFQSDSRVGAVGARLLKPDQQTLQHAGGYLEQPRLVARHFDHHAMDSTGASTTLRDVDFVTAAAMAVRVDALREVGYFNGIFSPGYYEDVDLCDRLRKSRWRVVYAPLAVATHVEAASFSSRDDRLSLSHRNRLIYALPWLVDPGFRTDFCAAERRASTVDAPLEERRALSLAYLQIILLMPDAMETRLPSGVSCTALAFDLIDMFGKLREDVLASLRHSCEMSSPLVRTGAAEIG